MEIENYKALILNLPVRQQCFVTKRTTWNSVGEQIDWLSGLNNKLFEKKENLNISRQDIFNSIDSIRELIVKTIYWGYSNRMRNNYDIAIFKQIKPIETVLIGLKDKETLTKSDFDHASEQLEKVSGLGLSTYSKLLYFLNIKFNENPCLILDQRLIDVFASRTYDNFSSLSGITYKNATKSYLRYLELTNQISTELGTRGENIEQFLFMFGNNLKMNF